MKLTKKQLKKIEKFAKEKIDDFLWQHIQRVRNYALKITKREGGDKNIIEIAALLHDIGGYHPTLREHAFKSSERASRFLRKIGLDEKTISKATRCIETHIGPIGCPGQEGCPRPKTLEEKILYDADMLELIGPFGILKMFYVSTTKRKRDFFEAIKIAKMVNSATYRTLFTKTAREIAKPLVELQKEFYKQLDKQLT